MVKKFLFIIMVAFIIPIGVFAKDDMAITMIQLDDLDGDGVLLESNGKYLLMDTFSIKDNANNHELIDYLAENNIFKFSVYISHYHEDHYGGLLTILNDPRFTIEKVYLPKTQYFCKEHASDQNYSESDQYFYKHYQRLQTRFNLMVEKNIPYEFLWPTNTSYPENEHCFNLEENSYKNKITIGDASIDIIGPVTDYNLDYFDRESTAWKTKGNWYLNNYSLVSIVSAGNVKYLTAGDMTKYEEEGLISQKPSLLKADIMKLSHHGSTTSNTFEFVKKVAPNYIIVMRGNNENTGAFDNLLVPEENCTSNCYKGANAFIGVFNKATTFHVENGVIQANPTENYKTIKFEYYDDSDQSLVKTRNYKFWTGKNYYLDSSYQEIPGYTIKRYDKNVVKTGVMQDDITYKVYLKKDKDDSNSSSETEEIVEIPNTLSRSSKLIIIMGIISSICGGLLVLSNIKKKKIQNK